MKTVLYAALFAACAAPAFAADVGVSISIGQPGFYGQIDIGNVPQPQVVYAQPVVIQPRRSTCTCHRATRNTGGSIARSITPVGGQSILCATTGTTTNMCRAIGTVTAIAVAVMGMVGIMTRVAVLTRVTAMMKTTAITRNSSIARV
jgi:hypothetical protein